jgi:ribose transport system permease protein
MRRSRRHRDDTRASTGSGGRLTSTEPAPSVESERAGTEPRPTLLSRFPRAQLPIAIFLVVIVVFFAFDAGSFFTANNWATLLSNIAPLGLIAVGQTLVIVVRGFDLSVAGVAPLAAVMFAKAVNGSFSPAEALVLMIVVGAAVGLVNGVLIVWVRINPLITTLGTMSVTGGLAFVVAGGQQISFNNPNAGFLANNVVGQISLTVVVWLVLVAIGSVLLRYSVAGRTLYSIGGNPEASWLVGLPVRKFSISVYMVSGMLAALAGVTIASQLIAADGTIASTAALDSIAAVVLGGAAITGGVLVLGVLQNGLVLININAYYQEIITGLALIFAAAGAVLRTRSKRSP